MHANIEWLKGKILTEVVNTGDEIHFYTEGDDVLIMYHFQDCCESVHIEDVNGDLSDLVGTPILVAEERISYDEPCLKGWEESYTWTFYTIRTIKGSVDIRWYGESNGYYSETVDFKVLRK